MLREIVEDRKRDDGDAKIEKDTDEAEDVVDLLALVLPKNNEHLTARLFGVAFNSDVFRAWVKQPSPCCGAASVAGAINAITNTHRNNESALNYTHIIKIYGHLFEDAIRKKTQSFNRKLGCCSDESIDSFITGPLAAQLQESGKEIGGKKGVCATKKTVMSALTSIVCKHLTLKSNLGEADCKGEGKENIDSDKNTHDQDEERTIVACIAELFELEGVKLLADKHREREEQLKKSEDEKDEEEEEEEDDEPEPEQVRLNSGALWDWKKDLMAVVKNIAGLKKLRGDRPNTAAIGNWAVQSGVHRVNEITGCDSLAIFAIYNANLCYTLTSINPALRLHLQ